MKMPAGFAAAVMTVSDVAHRRVSVTTDGRVGVGRKADGTVWVYLQTCHAPMDSARLYRPSDDSNPQEQQLTEWRIGRQPDPLRAEWPLLGPDTDTVVADPPRTALPSSAELALGGYTANSTYAASGPWRFSKAEIDHLEPGQVLISNEAGDPADPERPTTAVIGNDLDCSQYG